jgi:UDP-N-acetylmuramate--alanine ligase
MVVEADESDGSFIRLPATIAVVTNIDPEHLEHYGDFDDLRRAFQSFIENIPFYGFAVLCLDHPEVQAMVGRIEDRRIITYGLSPQAHVRAVDLRADAEGTQFDVAILKRGSDAPRMIEDLRLDMPGEHNVQNALAAIAIADELGITADAMRTALRGFTGVKRRFTKVGEAGGITVIDDYGHHPVEIAAVLRAARAACAGRVIAVVQPHRYSRLSRLFDDFCTCFNDADAVVVADVYPAGESPIEGADRDHLIAGIRAHGHRQVEPLVDPPALAPLIAGMAAPGDMVVCLGAGSITNWANALPEALAPLVERGAAEGRAR